MKIINIASPPWREPGDDPDGYRGRHAKLGPDLCAHATGMSVYEIDPGQAICPYHYECGEEEWLLVLSGRVVVRHPDGESELGAFDVVFFPVGPAGAHKVTNVGTEPARVLMTSNVVSPTITVYPDSGKVGVWPGAGTEDLIVTRDAGVDYWHGEVG